MRALILSDIHSNLEALQAVLAATEGLWDELWNLGDMVGYGGSPNEVIDLVRPLSTLVVRGNHDRVCCGLSSPNHFNPIAREAALWTRTELSEENLSWLREVAQGPLHPAIAGITCAHGSPLDEDRYILNMRDAWAPLQQMTTPMNFFGHTHIQGGFSVVEEAWRELHPRYLNTGEARNAHESASLRLPGSTRFLINPGSVGQPRDFDWRAAFALFDVETSLVTFHRVPYDLVAAQGRILMAGLPERLATRLREGR